MSQGAGMLGAMQNPIDRIARSQYGLASSKQLLIYKTRDALRAMIKRGEIERFRHGVYRFCGTPFSWEQTMLAAILAAPMGAVASCKAAGRLWQLPGCDNALVELTVPYAKSARMRDAIVHRSQTSAQLDRVRFNIPVASAERTLVDLSSVMDIDALAIAFDDALERRLVTVESIRSVAETMGTAGRGRSAYVATILDERSKTRYDINRFLHRRTVQWLEEDGVDGFEVEYRIHVGGKRRYIDIAWPDDMVALEVDGYMAHKSRSAFDHDRQRGNWIEASGMRILRITSKTTREELLQWVALARALSRTG